jgi:natural resistance-associated macrophage protein
MAAACLRVACAAVVAAGQFVMQGYLHMKISPVLRILVTRSVALVPALAVAVLTRNNTDSTALDTLNQWLNLVSSSCSVFHGLT